MPLFSREKPNNEPSGENASSSVNPELSPQELKEREELLREREEILDLQDKLKELLEDKLSGADGEEERRQKLKELELEGELEDVKELRDKILAKKAEFSKKANPFEKLINFSEQYQAQETILREAGILRELRSGKPGIEGIDGKEYEFPPKEDLIKRIKERREILEPKIEQGFTRLVIVPFAMPLDELIQKYGELFKKHYEEGKLFAPGTGGKEEPEPLELNTDEPVWVWDGYKDADTNGELVYYPEEFTQDHKGKIKAQILEEDPRAGFKAIFLEADSIIPREGSPSAKATEDKEGNVRKQIEAGKTPNEYLEMLKNDPQYQNEQGLTPEDWLAYAIANLEERNEATDDWQGEGSISYNTGAYFPLSGGVPYACWDRDDRQAYLSRNVPDDRADIFGSRSAVGV